MIYSIILILPSLRLYAYLQKPSQTTPRASQRKVKDKTSPEGCPENDDDDEGEDEVKKKKKKKKKDTWRDWVERNIWYIVGGAVGSFLLMAFLMAWFGFEPPAIPPAEEKYRAALAKRTMEVFGKLAPLMGEDVNKSFDIPQEVRNSVEYIHVRLMELEEVNGKGMWDIKKAWPFINEEQFKQHLNHLERYYQGRDLYTPLEKVLRKNYR